MHARFRRHGTWQQDARIARLIRFSATPIFGRCNRIDGCDQRTRPGHFFSATPQEMAAIRNFAGDRLNRGPRFLQALRTIREDASTEYADRESLASRVGSEIALEWMDDGTFSSPAAFEVQLYWSRGI
jgi:hypothetical protein